MKIKAEMGHWSSVVGNSVHLIAEDGRMIGQIAILCHTDDLRGKEIQQELCEKICNAINEPQEPEPVCDKCGHPRSNHPYRHPFVVKRLTGGNDD